MNLLVLAPLFLLGLGTLLVPVIVHLFHKHKREAVPFPSLMFIERIPFKDVRRQQLRHKFLFALRCLALALLAFAFARPLAAVDWTLTPVTWGLRGLARSFNKLFGVLSKKILRGMTRT